MNDANHIPEGPRTSQNTEGNGASPFTHKEWITVEEAVIFFRDLGLPRSPEAIRGYCRQDKLEATTTQGLKGEQHVIKRASAEIYIADRKKVLAAMSRDMPEQDGKSRKLTVHSETTRHLPEDTGTSQHVPAEDLAEKEAEITKLRDEVMSLKIDKQARDQIVIMLRDERAEIARDAREASRKVGELEATLRMAAPDEWGQLQAHQQGDTSVLAERPGSDTGDRPRSTDVRHAV